MTVLDHSLDDDAQIDIAHAETEVLVKRLSLTLGWSRKRVNEHLVAFSENDPDSPVYTTAAGKPRRRPRKLHAEAHAA